MGWAALAEVEGTEVGVGAGPPNDPTRLAVVPADDVPGSPLVSVDLVQAAREYFRAAKAPGTLAGYARDWRRYTAWCDAQGLTPLPAEPTTVALYISSRAQAGRKVATIERDLTAISEAHKRAGFPSPRSEAVVREVRKGIRRHLGTAQRRVAPILVVDLRQMINGLPDGLRGLRDRALLTVGFAGALRRSELVALLVEDLDFNDDGVAITITRSKTDQEGAGVRVGIPYGSDRSTCPVRAAREWLDAADIGEGPVFRSVSRHGRVGPQLQGRDVARAIKKAAEAIGLDPTVVSGHSLRAGLATQAAKAGKSDRSIMRQGRWRSRAMLDRYVRDAQIFEDNAATGIGL